MWNKDGNKTEREKDKVKVKQISTHYVNGHQAYTE
jgi:hypothetical protein